MGKAAQNKLYKRTSLLNHAYTLFTQQGFNKTTISDIVRESGLAKGTFYLYFKDKYDLRDQLVAKMSSQILLEAEKAIADAPEKPDSAEGYLFSLVDYILYHLQQNKMLLNFISKNLSWGVFEHAFEMADKNDTNNFNKIYQNFLAALQASHYNCDTPELLLFTIIELVNSTGYSTIMYETPCTLDEYLPHLHRCIHSILESYRVKPSEETKFEKESAAP